ncbi:MAG: hypothetical protein WCD79_05390 [Chthoniobacteraceae bacterium]
MRKYLPLSFGLVIIAVNLVMTFGFMWLMRRITTVQAHSTTQLPAEPHPSQEKSHSDSLRLTVKADGKIYAGDVLLTNESLRSLLKANEGRRIILAASKDVRDELNFPNVGLTM